LAIFVDTFTEAASDTELTSHTPDTGTGYSRIHSDGAAPRLSAIAATDRLKVSTGGNDSGVVYTCNGTYPSADYEGEITYTAGSGFATRPFYLAIRLADVENMYALRMTAVASGHQLYKKVAGTWSTLGSAVTIATGSVVKLYVSGTAIKVYDDGVEVISVTDSSLSAAGKFGFAVGGGSELVTSTDDCNTSWEFNDLTVTDLGGGTPAITVSDAVAVAESVALTVGTSQITVSDAAAVAESIGVLVVSFVSVSDSVSVSESAAVMVVSLPNVSDAVAVAESVSLTVAVSLVSVSDGVSVAEGVGVAIVTAIAVSDGVAVAESAAVAIVTAINVNDSVGIAESAAVEIVTSISVSDTAGIAESVSLAVSAPQVNASDSIAVSESVGVTIVVDNVFTVAVSDAITVAESISLTTGSPQVNVSDAAGVTDAPTVAIADLVVSVTDSLSLTEATVTLVASAQVYTFENIAASEAIAITLPGALLVSQSDTIGTSEAVAAFLDILNPLSPARRQRKAVGSEPVKARPYHVKKLP
jgi:hypothetical protein